jgi:hypothetical protein
MGTSLVDLRRFLAKCEDPVAAQKWCVWQLLATLVCFSCVSCGGGNSTSPVPTPPPSSFTISLSPGNVSLAQGGASQSVQVSVVGQGGFAGTVTVSVNGLPSGVTATPTSFSVTATNPGTFTVSASSTAQIAQQSIRVDGVSGTLTANATVQLSVTGALVPDPFHRVGGVVVHGFYDEARQVLFATNPGLNELDVISGQDFSIKARVPLPQPWGIDQMPDGKTLVIGTAAQSILTVDEDTLAVTQHPFSAIGNSFFTLFFPNVVAMANGKVLIIGQEEGIDSSDILDGGQVVYEWDSKADTFSLLLPTSPSFETDSLARSADHKWAAFSADQFYLYSSDSDSLTIAPLFAVNPPQDLFGVRGYALNADGTKIAVASATSVTFLNRSFGVLGSTAIPGAFQTARTSVLFSHDGSKLLLQYDLPIGIEEIDTSTYALLGYVSAVVTPENNEERLLATDSTERAFVGVAGGLRLADLRAPVPNAATGNFPMPNCSIPASTLPLNSTAQVQLSTSEANVSVYVGGQPAPLLSGGTAISIPASSIPGGADIECIGSDGSTAVVSDGVSYGVDPIATSANLLPPVGNPSVFVFGFGFTMGSSGPPAITVAGQPAAVAASGTDNFGVLQFATINVPQGTPGESADIVVSSSLGSGTLTRAATYYPSPTIVGASGLLEVLFDSHRNVLYGLKAGEVDVLNPNTLQWQTTLPLPQSGNATSYDVMALSPDGSRLVIASADGHVVVMNPDQPAQASLLSLSGNLTGPLAITKFNKVIFAGIQAVELDLATLALTPLSMNTGQLIRSSADGSHLYGADLNDSSGAVYSIDPSTHTVQTERFGQLFWTDLAVSTDGSQFAAVDAPPFAKGDAVGFFNSALQLLNTNAYPDFSPPDDTGVLGATFSPGGKVLVVALGDSIEFWDSEHGTLRARLMTPERLHVLVYPEGPVAPALALDSTGQTIYAISASGLTVLKLPQPLDQIPPMAWPENLKSNNSVGAPKGSIASRMIAMHGTTRK